MGNVHAPIMNIYVRRFGVGALKYPVQRRVRLSTFEDLKVGFIHEAGPRECEP